MVVSDRKQRRFQEAFRYVSRGWLPYHAQHLQTLRAQLARGAYETDRKVLLADLKSDFSLFSFAMKKLGGIVAEASRSLPPLQILQSVDLEAFKTIFAVPDTEIAGHELTSMKDNQAVWLKHSAIAATTAELVADTAGGDGDLAFTMGLLRQIGVDLVSWNYPSTCAKAESAMLQSGDPFDTELDRLLGYSPYWLGGHILLSWNQDPIAQLLLDYPGRRPSIEELPKESRETIIDIRTYCEIGTALSRVNDPEHYPDAVKGWKLIEGKISHYLGTRGLAIIQDKLADRYGHYVSLAPKIFTADLSPKRQAKVVNAQHSARLFEDNDFARKCGPEVQQCFKKIYDVIIQGEVSLEAVGNLVKRTVPQLGFEVGCVYLLDPSSMMLVPNLLVGNVADRSFRPISASCGGGRTHPVAEAFHLSMPLVEESVVVNGGLVSHVTGRFGNNERNGVLYLEMSPALAARDSSVSLQLFKAVRRCLDDCLNLR